MSQSVEAKSGRMPHTALGGSVLAGVFMTLIGAYNIVDCVRYQTGPGQCSEAVEKHAPYVLGGLGIFTAGWGGFNTFNPKLHAPSGVPFLETQELVIEPPPLPPPPDFGAIKQSLEEEIRVLYAEVKSQRKVADMLGITRYAVRKALRNNEEHT